MNDATQFFNTVAGGPGPGPGPSYQIERSLRFNSADSAYLNRTPASAGNRKTWTWAGWVKRSFDGTQTLFSARTDDDNRTRFSFQSSILKFQNGIAGTYINSDTISVFRDFSAWYHIVLVLNTTEATSSDRVKVYVNGTQQSLSGTFPSLNDDTAVSSNVEHGIGRTEYASPSPLHYFDGYLADVHFIDGQALTPSSFGEFDTNGVWQPKAYSGSYGTNGFHLPFSDNSTAAALGTDTSGAGNNWTVNNISVAAGEDNDSLVDTPTNYGEDTGVGGEVRGNYCTLNPLDSSTTSNVTSNGNLQVTMASVASLRGSFYVSTGKWYYEVTITTSTNPYLGLAVSGGNPTSYTANGAFGVNTGGDIWQNNADTGIDAIPLAATPFKYAIAFDADTRRWWIARSGVWYSADRAPTEAIDITDVENGLYGYDFSALGGDFVTPHFGNSSTAGTVFVVNFGQRPFAYPAPSGFKALCTTNLPEPTIADGSTAMDVVTYTGNGTSQTISGLGFSPDFVWIKRRDGDAWHQLYDQIRGVQKALYSNETSSELTETTGLTAFNSDGFTVGSSLGVNANTGTYVAWTWDAGSSTVTNNDGSITSQVRANPSAGFSVVTFTGATSSYTVGHGLGVAPVFYIIKARNAARDWLVYTTAIDGSLDYLYLNKTDAKGDAGNPAPTSTLVYPDQLEALNYVMYCFAPVAGYSAFGSYTGNGSADGAFIYTGFKPRWLMIKRVNGIGAWSILDTSRNPYNVSNLRLRSNSSDAEQGAFNIVDIVSNGFKLRDADQEWNLSETYIYAAFAEHPFQYSRAR